jgi:hypothetical protein
MTTQIDVSQSQENDADYLTPSINMLNPQAAVLVNLIAFITRD